MIYTVTVNPALDIVFYADSFKPGTDVRATQTFKYPGGKAINVSRMLYNLNIPSVATGFLGGYPGKFIQDWFDARNLETHFIKIEDDVRTNIKLKTPSQSMTITGVSPFISEENKNNLIYYLSRVREGDIVVMGGSIPRNTTSEIYNRMIEVCKANKAHFVIDIPPKATMDALKHGPLLIKPNLEGLAEMFDKPGFKDEDDIIAHGYKCIEMGAKNVIVSMGKEGSYLFTSDYSVYRSYGVDGIEVNAFNSRDAMIAAFIGVFMRKNEPVESFKMAAAAASATAFVEDLAEKEGVQEVFEKVIIEKIR